MKGYPRTVRLGTGEEVTLRPAEPSDEQLLLRFFGEIPEEDRLFLKDDVTDPEVIKRWMSNMDHSRVLPMLALVDGKVIGDGTLHRNAYGWSQHVAEVRVVVAKGWQRKGVGQVLIHDLLQIATEEGIEILEGQVLEGQHGAQRALEALGFHVETVLRDRGRDRSGRKRNVLVLTNNVAALWTKMEELLEMELAGAKSGRY